MSDEPDRGRSLFGDQDDPGLTLDELAEEAGVEPDRLRELEAAAVLPRMPNGRFRPTMVSNVRMIDALEDTGVPLAALSEGIRRGDFTFEAFDQFYAASESRTSHVTFAALAAELSITIEDLASLYSSMGLPIPAPDDRLREDDVQALRAYVPAWSSLAGNVDARYARAAGDAMRRLNKVGLQLYAEALEVPFCASDLSAREVVSRQLQAAIPMITSAEELELCLYHRHQGSAITAFSVEQIEQRLTEYGLHPEAGRRLPAIAFVDLTGFTSMTERFGDAKAVELASSLARAAERAGAAHGGRLVKKLGDGVMLRFARPADAVLAALELVERSRTELLVPAHAGVHAGPVVDRDGDAFGRTVNRASRVADIAAAGEVLVTREVIDAAGADHELAFEPQEARLLQGMEEDPMPLWLASRRSAGPHAQNPANA